MDAFDADVLVYGTSQNNPFGRPIRAILDLADRAGMLAGVGSVLLLPEILSHPVRHGHHGERLDWIWCR
jgi:hypothetical protein